MGSEMKFRLWQTGEFSIRELEVATPRELFEMWCEYVGIIGYADSIIKVLRECGYTVVAPTNN